MAKKTKYPRKLRVKLEKIAAARDAREAAGEDDIRPSTLWHEFMPKKSVHLMHGVVDEERQKLHMTYHLTALDHPPDRVVIPAPWLNDESPASE